jgi:hypothetical protein
MLHAKASSTLEASIRYHYSAYASHLRVWTVVNARCGDSVEAIEIQVFLFPE